MHRRVLLRAGAALPVLTTLKSAHAADGMPFSADTVRDAAQALAQKPYQAPQTALPDYLSHLDYDQYRMLRFDKAHALWRNDKLFWTAEFFHRGFLYTGRVDINEVVDGRSIPLRYDPSNFSFGQVQRPTNEDLGFAGFRLHAPINRPDYYDEVCSFLGASYFRAVAKGLGYGLSARGLSVKTADPGGEEFPAFTAFWIEKPKPRAHSIVVHALLDSPSATGAFRFDITPGTETVFDTTVTLFPRVDIDQAGIAPLTSMYFFGPSDRARIDDWRPSVHDTGGLLMATGRGEMLWRQLANPLRLQVSAFSDHLPRGFGLLQRSRDFTSYQDLESNYQNRPSLWIEPVGDWGEGAVMLVEIPTDQEIHDNIVAFWRPKTKLQAHVPYGFRYRMHWCALPTLVKPPAPVVGTRIGNAGQSQRVVIIDVANLKSPTVPKADVTSDKGEIRNVIVQPNPDIGGWRISFELAPGRESVIELHARLLQDATPISETWLYRWTT